MFATADFEQIARAVASFHEPALSSIPRPSGGLSGLSPRSGPSSSPHSWFQVDVFAETRKVLTRPGRQETKPPRFVTEAGLQADIQ